MAQPAIEEVPEHLLRGGVRGHPAGRADGRFHRSAEDGLHDRAMVSAICESLGEEPGKRLLPLARTGPAMRPCNEG